jgi:transcriptional regulator with XRE-family HTH domain
MSDAKTDAIKFRIEMLFREKNVFFSNEFASLARRAGVSEATLRRFELGKKISMRSLRKILTIGLGMTMEEICGLGLFLD